jgi:uncharacterized oxidoreductase
MQLDGKRVVVTGATRGIGRALTRQLVAAGAQVIGVARNAAALEPEAQEWGARFIPVPCDLADPAARTALIARLTGDLAPVDGLINNAGIQLATDFFEVAPERIGPDIATELEVNLAAPMHLSGAMLRHLAERTGGFVLNITSALALVPKEPAPVYCASKAALRSFTSALRYQAETHGNRVRLVEAVMPLVETDMTAGRGRGKITPEQAAAALLAGLRGGGDRIWVGKSALLRVMHRLAPGLAAWMLRRG